MSTKGELFNSDMVQAFLDGRKCRTSRPIKPYLWDTSKVSFKAMQNGRAEFESKISGLLCYRKPKYQPGDIMYARETWQCINPYSDKEYVYKATCDEDYADDIGKWRPSVHMPHEAARLWFRVTDVKVQNIKDVTNEDAEHDGFISDAVVCKVPNGADDYTGLYAYDRFMGFWHTQYGTDASWMWVYTLEKISKEDGRNE